MPVFEFKCPICERNLSIKDRYENLTEVKCEICDVKMIRVYEPHFHLKGECWEKDGYTKK